MKKLIATVGVALIAVFGTNTPAALAQGTPPPSKPVPNISELVVVEGWTQPSFLIHVDPVTNSGGTLLAGIGLPSGAQVDMARSSRFTIKPMAVPQGATGSCTAPNASSPAPNAFVISSPLNQATSRDITCTITDQGTLVGSETITVAFERRAVLVAPTRTVTVTVEVGKSTRINGLMSGVYMIDQGRRSAGARLENVSGAHLGDPLILTDSGLTAMSGDTLEYTAGLRPGTDVLQVIFCGPNSGGGDGHSVVDLQGAVLLSMWW